MGKKNCWEVKQCGRGPAAANDCAAAHDGALTGVHGGIRSGRACWVAAGTSCESGPSGTFAREIGVCFRCEFFRLVQAEEQHTSAGFSATKLGMLKMQETQKPSRQDAPTDKETNGIGAPLRNEFAQEVTRIMSGKPAETDQNGDKQIKEEFAREVQRLASESKKQ